MPRYCIYFLHGPDDDIQHVGYSGNPGYREYRHRQQLPGSRLEIVWRGLTKQEALSWEKYLWAAHDAPIYGYHRWIPKRGIRRWNPRRPR